MQLVDFVNFLIDQSYYIFEHPTYNRSDLMLRRILRKFKSCLNNTDKKILKKSNLDLILALKDLKTSSDKNINSKEKRRIRIQNIKKIIDIYESTVSNIRNELNKCDVISKSFDVSINELEEELNRLRKEE